MDKQFNSWDNVYGQGNDNKDNQEQQMQQSGQELKNEPVNQKVMPEAMNGNPYGTVYGTSRNIENNAAQNIQNNVAQNIQNNVAQNTQNNAAQNIQNNASNFLNLGGNNSNRYDGAGNLAGNGNYYSTKSPKKPSFGRTMGRTVAVALVFGLVAGSVFTGVSFAGNKILGIGESSYSIERETGSSKDKESSEDNKIEYNPTNGALSQTSTGNATDLTDVSSIVREVMPSVVAITNTATITYRSFWGETYSKDSQSCGSGFIIDQTEDSIYIATNNHVVAEAETLNVQFEDGEVVTATIRGTDPSDDLAVVEVKIKDVPAETLSKIKVASIADSSSVNVGESAIAIGNALGYGQSVTTGVISALGRSVTTSDDSTGQTVTNSNLIQTDAAINPGNSGGALLNKNGEVIGINSVKYASTEVEGIGYAIPISDALPILETIIKDGKYTNTQTAYLGIQGLDVSSDMSAYNIPTGIYVSKIYNGSGADKAGILEGDIITAIDGNKISSMNELQAYLRKCSAGDEIVVTISRQQGRGYQESDIKVILSSEDEMKN